MKKLLLILSVSFKVATAAAFATALIQTIILEDPAVGKVVSVPFEFNVYNASCDCLSDETCCEERGCCPYPNGVCCSGGKSCCPQGSKCNLKEGTCENVHMHANYIF